MLHRDRENFEPKVAHYDVENKVLDILQKYSINYEYDKEDNSYVVYGYR